jgi:hypothetical protein
MKRVLNLGAGTQSSVILIMADRGLLEPVDYAVFSDPGWEGKAVYEHLLWLEKQVSIPIVRVSAGNIYQDAMQSQIGWSRESAAAAGPDRRRWVSMPLYVRNNKKIVTFAGESLWGMDSTEYVIELDDPELGQIKRQCTSEYKIIPVMKWIKKNVFGLEPRARWPLVPSVTQVFGISYDERSRCKIPPAWANFEYPLVELGWNRFKVIDWAQREFPDHYFPRSACLGCPFHDNTEWRWIRDNDPEGWEEACLLDERMRNAGGMRGEVFLHRSCTPLRTADLDEPDTQQLRLIAGFENECQGLCGV